MKHVKVETITGVEEINSQLEASFSMAACLSSNSASSVRWYVDSGDSRHEICHLYSIVFMINREA